MNDDKIETPRASDTQHQLPQGLSNQGPHIGKERTGMAGGFFIAIFPVIGAIIGGFMGQPSAGLLAGLALGILIAVAIWLVDRNKGPN